jgi:hypothetical protein
MQMFTARASQRHLHSVVIHKHYFLSSIENFSVLVS